MKKSYWLILLILVALGAGAYFYGGSTLQGDVYTGSSSSTASPDLAVASISKDSSGHLNVTVANKGSVDVTGDGLTYVYINGIDRPTWTYKWSALDDRAFLTAGGTSTLTPQTLKDPGAYDVKVCVDAKNNVTESDETNNCLSQTLFVMPTFTESFVDFGLCQAGTGTTVVTAADTVMYVDGSSCKSTSVATSGDSTVFKPSIDLTKYKYVSFWVYWEDVSAGRTTTFTPNRMSVFTADANDGVEDQTTSVAAGNVVGSPSFLKGGQGGTTDGHWYLVQDVAIPVGTDAADTYIGLQWNMGSAVEDKDYVWIDSFTAYNK